MKVFLELEDGSRFYGSGFGAVGSTVGEVVFNTSMTGYQEILTDASYYGQIVMMTYPLIGNYGINEDDFESSNPQIKGFIAKEICRNPSNWRTIEVLENYLKKNNIVGIEGIDTRELTKLIRNKGAMRGIITSEEAFREKNYVSDLKKYKIADAVKNVTTSKPIYFEGKGNRVVILDFGMKKNILNSLLNRECEVFQLPAYSSAKDILNLKPDGIMLTNGPGDPMDCTEIIETLKELYGKKPIFGICLGHQLLALANNVKTNKLKYGHRGSNHPVKDIEKDRVYITSQNHGYTIDKNTIDKNKMHISHTNMNDSTVEGIRYKEADAFTVQFHPEASPGPQETGYLFDEFIELMNKKNS